MGLFKTKRDHIIHTRPVRYPSGLFVDDGVDVWMIVGDYKKRLFSQRVLNSWAIEPLFGSQPGLAEYKDGGVLGFRNGTLIKNISNGSYYLISDNKRRHIVSPDVFTFLNIDPDSAIIVSDEEAKLHPEGEVLS